MRDERQNEKTELISDFVRIIIVSIIVIRCCIGVDSPYKFYAKNIPQTYIKGLYSLPLSLDPIQMNDTASLAVGNLIFDGLLKFSPSLKIEGALAESWATSKDGKTITFRLKPNIYFHSGEPITSYDAEFSIKRALSLQSKVRKYYDSIKDIKAVDDKTLEIILNYSFPPFLSILAGATAKVLPKSQVTNPNFFKNPIGSGAFKFAKHDYDKKEIILNGFDKYYNKKPKIETLILKETTEDEAIKLAKAGKIHDLANWPLTENDLIFQTGKKISSPVAATWIIGLNTVKEPFNNLNTRRLFKNNIPVEEFRKKFYPDASKANGYVPNGLPGSQFKVSIDTKNIKPPKSKISLVIPTELARGVEMKDFLEHSMKAQGWNIEVILTPWDKLMDGYAKKSHQSFLVSMNMDYPDADFLLKNFESDNPDNFSGLNNPEIDNLLKKSRSTQDRKLREEYYKSALILLEESAVTVNLFHPRANYWISICVENFNPNILSDVYIDYSKISLTPDCTLKEVVKQ